jgi:hypothetical protein
MSSGFATPCASPENAPTCRRCAVLGAIRMSPLARLGRAKNSEDPRTWATTAMPRSVTASRLIHDLADVAAALGLPADAMLRMPDIHLD